MNKKNIELLVNFNQAFIKNGDSLLGPLNIQCKKGELLYIFTEESMHSKLILTSLYGQTIIEKGQANILGTDIVNMSKKTRSEIRKNISILNQQSYLIDHLTLKQNADFYFNFVKKYTEPDTRFFEVIWNRKFSNSKKKVINLNNNDRILFRFALSLLHNPELYLIEGQLDNLDFELQSDIMSELISLARKRDMGIIILTSDEALITRFPGRVFNENQTENTELTVSN